ncbi:hypothetical protein [Companilactobacillus hulinensis]|uniref:hypothetical protein n=1 Tax=Companilactobacillus hulinensis TaxID=2486007 RepID=UPI0013DE3E12|nr:hypothetical protein [Companilactobacillus hulinensis]
MSMRLERMIQLRINEFSTSSLIADNDYLKRAMASKQFDLSLEIRRLERELNLSQKEASDALNISLDRFKRYEAGDKRIPEDRYQKVIDELSDLRDDRDGVFN